MVSGHKAPLKHQQGWILLQVYASLLREEGQPPSLTRCFGHELCAGLIDKAKSLKEIASEEVWPEIASTCSAAAPI